MLENCQVSSPYYHGMTKLIIGCFFFRNGNNAIDIAAIYHQLVDESFTTTDGIVLIICQVN